MHDACMPAGMRTCGRVCMCACVHVRMDIPVWVRAWHIATSILGSFWLIESLRRLLSPAYIRRNLRALRRWLLRFFCVRPEKVEKGKSWRSAGNNVKPAFANSLTTRERRKML